MRYVRRILLHPAASLRAARPPIRPSPSPRHPVGLPFTHVPPSSTGGSNGCGGICQAVTHPHGRILGYVFARSLPPAFHPCHVLSLPFFLPPFSPPAAAAFLDVRICIHSSVRPSVHTRPTSPPYSFFTAATSPRAEKRGVTVPPPPYRGIRFARIQREEI